MSEKTSPAVGLMIILPPIVAMCAMSIGVWFFEWPVLFRLGVSILCAFGPMCFVGLFLLMFAEMRREAAKKATLDNIVGSLKSANIVNFKPNVETRDAN